MDSNSWEIVESPSSEDKHENPNDNRAVSEVEEEDAIESSQQSAKPMTQRYGQNVKNYE